MVFRRKQTSVIDQKLRDIDKEIARISREIKVFDRSHRVKASASSLSKPQQNRRSTAGTSAGRANKYSGQTDTQRNEKIPAVHQKPLIESKTSGSHNRSEPQTAGFEDFRNDDSNDNQIRDKFVNYFAADHFQDLHPTRHNNSVLRNKAIMMAILALLAAFGILFHFLGN